LKDKLKIK